MNTRILTVVATLTLLTLSSGCSGMRNFLFGRGARCGLCNSQRAPLFPRLHPNRNANVPAPVVAGGATQGLCGQGLCGQRRAQPYAPQSYAPQNYAAEPSCGNEPTCGHEPGCGYEIAADQCNCGGVVSGTSNYGPTNYGTVVDNYAPAVSDPYMSGNVVGGYPVTGQIIDGQIVGGSYPSDGTVIGSSVIGGTIMGDNFSPRYGANKVDTDGARILSEDPLPPGMTPILQ